MNNLYYVTFDILNHLGKLHRRTTRFYFNREQYEKSLVILRSCKNIIVIYHK